MIPYARQSVDDSDIAAVTAVLQSDFLTQGPVVPRFESAVGALTGAAHAIAVANATCGLHLACRAVDVGPGDIVWTSPISFVASANCALYCGAAIDFVDIDQRSYNMSVDALETKLKSAAATQRLPKAVVIVDFAGQPCEMAAIASLRERYGFRIIEDASHAVGATYAGRRIGGGGLADITVFSFHPVKIITTGEGGMLLTDDEQLASKLRLLRSHGVTRDTGQMENSATEPWEYEQIDLGYNYRLTDLQAALGISQVERIEEFLSRRRTIAQRYDRELRGLPLTTPWQHPDCGSAYHLYPIRIQRSSGMSRRQVYDALRERGIAPNVHYIPIHTQPYYRRLGFGPGDFPHAEAYYAEALSLPMYPGLSTAQQERVIAALNDIFKQ